MSDFIRILNLIKARRKTSWLTPSQEEAFWTTREALRVPRTVNLCGAAGTGKTFLAWALADELGYTYLPHLNLLGQVEELQIEGVVLDNCRSERQAHRNVLKVLSFRNVHCAVLITRQTIEDYTHYAELKLTPDDQAKVRENLVALNIFAEPDEVPNLWHLTNPYL